MPPKGSRAGRTASAATAASGRASSRIAAKQTEAQQAQQAQQLAFQAAEAAANAPAQPPDSSMPPPASRGRGRGRGKGDPESLARRGTARGGRGGASVASSPASFSVAPRTEPYSDALSDGDDVPQTPQVATAANTVYADAYANTSQQTPRTKNATANLMNKYVGRLFDASKELLSHLAMDVKERDEAWIHELLTHKEFFDRYFKIYTQDSPAYIDIDAVADRTRSSDNEALWPRMTQAIAAANLANLLSTVEDLDSDPVNVLNRLPVLERIDDQFPVPFILGGRDGLHSQNWLIDRPTVEQAFAVRAQRFVETLRNYQSAYPLRSLAKVFFDIDCDKMTNDMLDENIDTAPYRPFVGFDISAHEAQEYRDRINGFRAMLTQMESEELIAQLGGNDGEYNFGSFLAGFKQWIRTSETSLPGLSGPLTHLAYGRDSPSSAGAQLHAEAKTSRFAASGISALKQRLGRPATQEMHGDPTFMDEGSAYGNFDSQSVDGTVLEAYHMGQEGLTSQDTGSLYAAAAAQGAAQNLSSGGGRKRNRKNAGDGNSHAKRARDAAAMPLLAPFPAPDPNAPAGSPSVDFDPLALSQAAQLITKANKKQTMPKARRPWTVHDTQQLVRAIDVYRAKWSTIQKAIENHHVPFNVIERDQQGLRDKARLVKVDILKTDSPLPPSFDMVVLGRKEKEMVMNAGKNPNRREADVDANGRPINTLYNPNAPEPPPLQAASHQQAPSVAANEVEDAEMTDLRPLQEEAQMAMDMNNRLGQRSGTGGDGIEGAPDAPMMTGDMDGQTQLSEELGEALSAQDLNDEPPIDPNMSEADPGIGQG